MWGRVQSQAAGRLLVSSAIGGPHSSFRTAQFGCCQVTTGHVLGGQPGGSDTEEILEAGLPTKEGSLAGAKAFIGTVCNI